MLRLNATKSTINKFLTLSKLAAITQTANYSASYDEWKKLAKSQLKDKSADTLIRKTAEVREKISKITSLNII